MPIPPRAPILLLSALAACLPLPAAAGAVRHTLATVDGLQVDRYAWSDSQGLLRSVSLKQEGNGNPGHGGYAIRMTYQVQGAAGPVTVTVDAEDSFDGGFGYFVSHERFRNFTDGANDTIAGHIFNTDDSPLGLGFPVTGTPLRLNNRQALAHQFTMTYQHYGTVMPIAEDANGNDLAPTPVARAKFALYDLPVTITWVFQSGTDYPRIDTAVDLSQVPQHDLVSFDVRGPYGVMVFDDDADGTVDRLMWGDRFHFVATQRPPTRDSGWNWNQPNRGARYTALAAGGFEMGLFEPRLFSHSAVTDNFAYERGRTSATFNSGNGCEFGETQLLPCDFEWPYQSLQYSLPTDDLNAPTNFKKLAWGSTDLYGSGGGVTALADTVDADGNTLTTEPFDGFPAGRTIAYSVCVVLGQTTPTGLTHDAAARRTGCAKAPVATP